ncbi:NACHT domain-containing protein [Streptomyces sp. Go40/10]|uniref:NACHT domain-containing protein n=1 Tax=Streptomyces sp. Go40/10 TaxID=2825844 RepID=UPI001E45495F|nr:NACHT domain-containing protein [Streptomyces sp. Go40/10]UFR06804.1 NACHT domain-containing protein [Streptomyces sp. Go40/10]
MSVMNKLRDATGRDWLRRTIQLAAGGWLAWTFTTQGLSNADSLSSVLALVIGLLSNAIQNPPPKQPLAKVLPLLRADVKRFWSEERKRRGLHRKPLISVTLTDASPTPAPLLLDYGLWDVKEYAERAADLLASGKLPSKAVISGEAGTGKTTFAVLLTYGLAKSDGYVPLYLPLASWSPRDEAFTAWFERQVLTTFPRLREVEATPEPLLRDLLNSDKVLLILDGLDELRDGQAQESALAQINACIDDDMPLLLLTRACPALPLLHDAVPLRLKLLDSPDVAHYLDTMTAVIISDPQVPLHERVAWLTIHSHLTSGTCAPLTHLLSRPLYLDLLIRTGLRNPSLAVQFLNAVSHGVEAAKKVLYASFVDDVLDARSLSDRRARLARCLAVRMATEMSKPPVARTMAWWRLYARVPPAAFGVAMAPLTAPAYQLCLLMPAGLTRGFALGTVTGVVLGVCRGVDTRAPAGVAAAVAGSAAAVMTVGAFWVGWDVAAVDTVEIAPVVGFVFWGRRILVSGTWHDWRTWRDIALSTAAAASASALTTCGTAAVLAPRADPPRSLLGVFMAVCMGLVVATVSARLLTSPAAELQPATASFQPRGNPLPHLVAATTAAAAVGVAGGFVGGVSRGAIHGLHVGLFFGAVAGPGIGLAGGLIRWLNQPGPQPTATAQRLYRRDRWLAVLSVVGVAAGATAGLAVLDLLAPEFMQSLSDGSFTAGPLDGILFGATIGIIVASFNTAWPSYAVCMAWFTVRHRVPWSLLRYLDVLHTCGILRQEGPLYSFRDEGLQLHLAE